MRKAIIVTSIFALAVIAGILIIRIPELTNPSPAETTGPFVLHELPPSDSVSSTTTEATQEVGESEDSIGLAGDVRLADTSGDDDAFDQDPELKAIPRLRLDVEGCPSELSLPPESTIYSICTTYTTDGRHVYFHDVRMNADARTFEVYPVGIQEFAIPNAADLLFAHDHNTVYFQDQALVGVTPDQFNILGLDPATFDIFKTSRALRAIVDANPNLPLLERLFDESDLSGKHMDEFGLSLLEKPDYIVAILNGKNIMYSEIGMMYFPSLVPRSLLVRPDTHEEWRKKFANELIERKLRIEAAEKQNLAPTSEEFEAKLPEYINHLGGEEFVRSSMRVYGMNESQLHDKIRGMIAIDNLKEKEGEVDSANSQGIQSLELTPEYVANLKKSAKIVILD